MRIILAALFFVFVALPAHGALDQTSDSPSGYTGDSDGASSTLTFSSPVTNGCAIIVMWNGYNASNYDATSVTDGTNSYTLIKHTQTGSTSSVPLIAYALAVTGSITTIAINHTYTSGNYIRARAFSWCGLHATPVDQPGEATTVTGTSTQVDTTGSTAQADELVVAVAQVQISSTNVHVSDPPSAAYTSLFVEQDHIAHVGGEAAYKIVALTAAQLAIWAHDDASGGGVEALIQTFKLAAGAAPVRRHKPMLLQ